MKISSQPPRFARIGAILLFAVTFGMAHGQATIAYRDVHNMYPSGTNEQSPWGGVAFDSAGNAYGTMEGGGKYGGGLVWEYTKTGSFEDIHDFGGTITTSNGTIGDDGTEPKGPISFDSSGNMYGTATVEGANGVDFGGYGMVWEITSTGTYLDLHDFGGSTTLANGNPGNDGQYPSTSVAVTSSGDIFGTTTGGGGLGLGMAFLLVPGSFYQDVHDFGEPITLADGSSGGDGQSPQSGPTVDSSNDIFGTTYSGGANGSGMVWELTPSGNYTDLHDFGGIVTLSNGTSGLDGQSPYAGVTRNSTGNLYGVTYFGGGTHNAGMVWEIPSGGTYKDLHDFGGTITLSDASTGNDGSASEGSLYVGSFGELFGVTQNGGKYGQGIVWELASTGLYIDQHDFGGTVTYPDGSSGQDGANPLCVVTLDSAGNVWGTCREGGGGPSWGNIWELDSFAVSSLSLSPSTIVGGYSSTGTVTLNSPVGYNTTVSLTNQWPTYVTVPTTVLVPAGSSSATFTASVSKLYSATFTNQITATVGSSSQSAVLTVTGEKLSSLTLSPSTIGGLGTSTGTITITNPAPPGGWVVNLVSALPSYVSVPSSVTVAAGATTANFTLTGLGAHVSTVTCSIYATDEASGTSASLTLQGDSIAALTLNPSTIGWSGTSTGTVTLNSAAPPGGWVINLGAGASGYLSMPSSVTVLSGQTSATFTITGAAQHNSNLSIRVNASDGATGSFAILNLVGDSLASVTLSPSTVASGKGSTGTITLSAPAPAGGWNVNLEVGAPSLVGVPASVTVPAGATSVTFPVTTAIGAPATSVTVIANDGTSQQQTTLTIT